MDAEALGQTYLAPTQVSLTPGGGTALQLPVVEPSNYIDRVEIARGGMGRILAARDRRLGRAVAIKELRTDSPDLRARFSREALLTARLQHPAIVSIHEAGVWPSGQPFYAMKLVPGRSLDLVIAAAPTLVARLALLPHVLAVADALAYAHQQRVIHRDLKPHNVLVGDFGETVVIDWGLAKDLAAAPERAASDDGHADENASATTVGDVIGTPAYMPPEQANGDAVDERADVYAIGALLYHLLAGRPAYDGTSAIDVLDRVLAGPPAPLAEAQPGVPVDLLAIVARAMARAPADRYADARGLAEDLRRFQAGQLVGAHRYSWQQHMARWLRRNRRAVGVGGTALVIMVACGAVAVSRIVEAEARAQDERTVAVLQRVRAEDLVDFMLGDLRDQLRPLNRLALLDRVARKARGYDSIDPARRARTLDAIAEVQSATGHRSDALATRAEAVALAAVAVATTDTREARAALAMGELRLADERVARGDLVGAEATYRAAIAGDSPPATAGAYAKLSDLAVKRGTADVALADALAALAVEEARVIGAPDDTGTMADLAGAHSRLGNVLRKRGASTAALAAYRTALDVATALVAAAPDHGPYRRLLAVAHEKMGNALHDHQDDRGALAEHRAALALRVALAAADPANLNAQRDLSVSYEKVGDLQLKYGDNAGALAAYQADLAIAARIAAADPRNAGALRDLAVSHIRLADLLHATHALRPALAEDATAMALFTATVVLSPTDLGLRHDLATACQRLGNIYTDLRDVPAAAAMYRMDLAINAGVVARDPQNLAWQRDLAISHDHVGDALRVQGDRTGALAEYRQEREIQRRLAAHDAANPTWQSELADTEQKLAALGLREARRLAHNARTRR